MMLEKYCIINEIYRLSWFSKAMKVLLQKIKHHSRVVVTSLMIPMLLVAAFPIVEPLVANAIEDQFTIKQTITAEISFQTPATDIVMSGSLAGITGGTSNGGTQVNVLTNNILGYTMTIKASSSPAMQGDTQGGTIPDYTPATTGVPDAAFSVAANQAEFGYTFEASSTSDLALKFKDNGSGTCNTGSSDTADTCWYSLSTAATSTIVSSAATAASGSTSTIKFRLTINANPSPAIPQDTYTATTTLTATTN